MGRVVEKNVELIAGIILDDGQIVPEITVRGMMGQEEDLFTNRKEAQKGTLFTTLLSGTGKGNPGCITKIGELVNDGDNCRKIIEGMFQPDRVYVLMNVRSLSHEDESMIYPELACPHCGEMNQYQVDMLDEDYIPITKKPDPAARGGTCTLPDSGLIATYRFSTGEDDAKMAKIRKSRPDEVFTEIMLITVTEIESFERVTRQVLKRELTMRDRRSLRKKIEEQEGQIDTEVKNNCLSCGKDFNLTIDILDPDFFFGSSE